MGAGRTGCCSWASWCRSPDTTPTDGGNCGACGATCASYTAAGLASGLLGHWRFNEGAGLTAADASGNAYTATLIRPAWVSGYLGSAIEGDGASNYLNATLAPGSAAITR